MNRPDPARIEKILGTFHPKRKPAFEEIHPWRSLIEGLRDKGASYDDIAEILKQEGVQTSDTTVRKFCHKALIENKKSRRQRKLLAQTGKVRHRLRTELGAMEISMSRMENWLVDG